MRAKDTYRNFPTFSPLSNRPGVFKGNNRCVYEPRRNDGSPGKRLGLFESHWWICKKCFGAIAFPKVGLWLETVFTALCKRRIANQREAQAYPPRPGVGLTCQY